MHRALRCVLTCSAALLPSILLSWVAPAHAADVPLTTPVTQERDYTASLQAATRDRAVRTLDWRTPSLALRFDLSQADIINDLSITLSADPLPGVNPDTPLMVQFNQGPPQRIETRGQGFDAAITLDPTRARPTANVLRLSYGADCLQDDGGYALNLDESRIRVSAQPKPRRLQLREVERRLGASAFAPDTVGLIASGPLQTRFEALGAQGIGLRMDALPDFTTTINDADFSLVMMTRSELFAYTDEADILSGEGPRIALSRAHPNRLFLTGDTQADVLQSVQAFSSFYLPQSRRSITTPAELTVQSRLRGDRTRIDGSTRLDQLSVQTRALREYVFNVTDPSATQGDLVLRLTRDSQTAPGARMKAVLNGVSLGEATLNARRKTVAYPIRPGLLNGTDNRLELTTKAGRETSECGAGEPFISIGTGSRLRLESGSPTAPADLSLLAANGSVFAARDGADTAVTLPESRDNYEDALSVVARLAQASGGSWTQAEFARGNTPISDRHRLVVEPYREIDADIRAYAPRGLQSAWNGQPAKGDNRLASIERFASLDAEEAVRLAARRSRADGTITSGGVAAIFPDRDGRLIGVISNTPGQSFGRAVAPLASNAHWNGLTGGVTRWNDRAVVMAQTALPAPGLRMTAEDRTGQQGALDGIGQLIGIDLPHVEIPAINLIGADDVAAWVVDGWDTLFDTARRSGEVAPQPAPLNAPDPAPSSQPTPDASMPTSLPAPEPAMEVSPRLKPAPAVQTVANGAPMTTPELRGSMGHSESDPGLFGSRSNVSLPTSVPELRNSLSRLDKDTQGLRAKLRRTMGIERAHLEPIRIGSVEIPPAAYIMTLLILLILIGVGGLKPSRAYGGDPM